MLWYVLYHLTSNHPMLLLSPRILSSIYRIIYTIQFHSLPSSSLSSSLSSQCLSINKVWSIKVKFILHNKVKFISLLSNKRKIERRKGNSSSFIHKRKFSHTLSPRHGNKRNAPQPSFFHEAFIIPLAASLPGDGRRWLWVCVSR